MILRLLRVTYKTPTTVFLVLTFFPTSFLVRLWRGKNYRKTQIKLNQFYTRLGLKLWGIKTHLVNAPSKKEIHSPPGWLMVSNHFGFVDAFAMVAHFPINFVTSREMHETPIIGPLTEMGCCFYVERRDRSKIHHEKSVLASALRDGYNIMLYPEGTSSDAQEVLPFKRTLMMSAADADVPIQLICVNFKKVNGEKFSHKWRDHVCWYGDLSFAKHCLLLMSLKSVELEIKFIEQMRIKPDENKDEVSKRAHKLVSSHYVKIPLV